MATDRKSRKNKHRFLLLIDKQQIRLYMAFSCSLKISMQFMASILFRKRLVFQQFVKHFVDKSCVGL